MIFQFLLDVSICYVILATQIVELYMNYPTGGSATAQRVLEHQPDFIDRKYQHSAINYLFGIIEWSCGNTLMQNEPLIISHIKLVYIQNINAGSLVLSQLIKMYYLGSLMLCSYILVLFIYLIMLCFVNLHFTSWL